MAVDGVSRVRIGVIFPGQGSQAVGMGGDLVERSPVAADLFRRAERILGYDLRALIAHGSDEALRETRHSQPAIFVVGYALAASLGDALAPVASAGHSFAEFCSLTLAGALPFDDALALVHARALAMQAAADATPGAMTAILGLDAHAVRAAVARASDAGLVDLANFNAPGQIVVSGERAAVARAAACALEAGAKRVVPLNVSGAWHSALMAPARERFAPAIAAAPLVMPRFTVVSNVDARPYQSVAEIRTNLLRSVTDEVRWHETAERLVAEGLDLIVEFGGSAVLAPLMKRVPDAPNALFVGDGRGLDRVAARLAEPAHA